MKIILFTTILFFFYSVSFSQNIQSIGGKIIEKHTQEPILFAKVELLNSELVTMADSLGYFELINVPVSRISLLISANFYKEVTLSNLELITGKQLLLTIEMDDDLELFSEVVVTTDNRKKSYNESNLVNRRQFSIEESNRYAGSLNDVQRMASGFAGVTTANDQVNDLIIRGNMPSGMLFRLDGMNIPNPNHYSMPGSAGGTVSMLNNNVLRNSDFLTGAFSSEYDAFSGVFDLKTRVGNYNKHEFLGQVGFNGLELGAEGPISKKSKASYLVNYRKSLLEILSLLVDFGTGTSVPKYQDLFFKINLPTQKSGTFSVIALGGTSIIHFLPEENKQPMYQYEDLRSGSNTGLTGLTHTITRKAKYTFSSSLLVSGVLSKTTINTI